MVGYCGIVGENSNRTWLEPAYCQQCNRKRLDQSDLYSPKGFPSARYNACKRTETLDERTVQLHATVPKEETSMRRSRDSCDDSQRVMQHHLRAIGRRGKINNSRLNAEKMEHIVKSGTGSRSIPGIAKYTCENMGGSISNMGGGR